MLIYYDMMAQEAGLVDDCGCTYGTEIDLCHVLTFVDNGIDDWYYGGNRRPNGWWGNPVPNTGPK